MVFSPAPDPRSLIPIFKVYGYACVYKSLNKVDIKDLTLSFVESRYPRDLLAHLRYVRGYTVEEKQPGVYIISGDILPIQIIDSRKLSENENVWLKDLYNKLEPMELRQITMEIYRLGKDKVARLDAYLNVVMKANSESLKEMINMSKSKLTLDEVFETTGLAARWEARGEAKGEARGMKKARKEERKYFLDMLDQGLSVEEIKRRLAP